MINLVSGLWELFKKKKKERKKKPSLHAATIRLMLTEQKGVVRISLKTPFGSTKREHQYCA